MRKIKLLLTLFMAFVGISASHAEGITTTPVQDGSQITDGYYVIRTNSKTENGQNKIIVKNDYIKWIKSEATDESMVWKLTNNGDGTVTMKHVTTQTYIGKKVKGSGISATGSDVFVTSALNSENPITVTLLGQSTEESNKDEFQYTISTKDNGMFHCEAADWNESYIVNYSGGINTASAWCFEKVENTIGEALDKKFANKVSTITITCKDLKGNILNNQTKIVNRDEQYINIPEIAYHTFASLTVDGQVITGSTFTPTEAQHDVVYTYTYNLPFTTNEINGEFTADTKWYLLKIRKNRYLRYNPDDGYLYVTAANAKGLSDEYWWTFSGNYENGIKVYNKAAGATKIMRSVTPPTGNEGGTNPQMIEISTVDPGLNTDWDISSSALIPGENGFLLSRKGEDTKVSHFGGGDNVKLAFYGSVDEGSVFTVTPFEDEQSLVLGCAPENIFAVGTLKEEIRDTYQAAINNIPGGVKEATEIIANPDNFIQFTSNSYYKILNRARGEYYMTAQQDMTINGEMINNTNGSQLWKIEGDAENGYNITAQNVSICKTESASENTQTTSDISKACKYLLPETQAHGYYIIRPKDGGQDLHLKDTYKVVGWGYGNQMEKDASAWMFIPTNSIDLEVTNAGYATINYPFAVELPKGLTAYTGTVNGDKVDLTEVEGKVIPANSPVILAGNAQTYTLNILADNTDPALTSSLEGTCLSKTIEAETKAYVLAKPEGENVGFYILESGENADRTIGINKAYLTETTPNGIKAYTFDLGGTTGIENAEIATETEEYYDLQGRRVMNPSKGIYVTKSGKKVFFTK